MGYIEGKSQSALTSNTEEVQLEEEEPVVDGEVHMYVFFEEKENATVMGLRDGKVIKKAMFGQILDNTLLRFATMSIDGDTIGCRIPATNFKILERVTNGEINNFMITSHYDILKDVLEFTDEQAAHLLATFGIKAYSDVEEGMCYLGTPSFSAPEDIPPFLRDSLIRASSEGAVPSEAVNEGLTLPTDVSTVSDCDEDRSGGLKRQREHSGEDGGDRHPVIDPSSQLDAVQPSAKDEEPSTAVSGVGGDTAPDLGGPAEDEGVISTDRKRSRVDSFPAAGAGHHQLESSPTSVVAP